MRRLGKLFTLDGFFWGLALVLAVVLTLVLGAVAFGFAMHAKHYWSRKNRAWRKARRRGLGWHAFLAEWEHDPELTDSESADAPSPEKTPM